MDHSCHLPDTQTLYCLFAVLWGDKTRLGERRGAGGIGGTAAVLVNCPFPLPGGLAVLV